MEEREFTTPQLICDSIIVGIFSGLGAVFYRWLLTILSKWTPIFFDFHSISDFILILLALFVGAIFVTLLLRWAPFSSGSGIPQIYAELRSEISVAPIPTIISKIIGGGVNNFFGLSLGREGPSIQIAGTIAKKVAQLFHRSEKETKYLIAAGASAGLSAAFNAPIAGALFAVEEIYQSFAPTVLLPAFIASIIANMLAYLILGVEPAFSFSVQSITPLDEYHWIILVGIVGGLIGCLFNVTLDYNQRLFKRLNFPPVFLFFGVFCLSFALSHIFPVIQGGGHSLIESLVQSPKGLLLILCILFGNLVFTTISFSTGAQGGIFLPVLVIGAATGVLVHHVAISIASPNLELVNFLILGMVAVLTAVVRSPFMSILLISEMTGNPNTLMPLAIAGIVAWIVSNGLRIKPVYTILYEKLLIRVEQAKK